MSGDKKLWLVCQGEVAGTGAVRMAAEEVRSSIPGERELSARSALMGLWQGEGGKAALSLVWKGS